MRDRILEFKAVFYRDMALWLRYPSWIFVFFAFPYLFTGMFYAIGVALAGPGAVQNFQATTGTENFLVYNVAGMGIFMAAVVMVEDAGAAVRREQLLGTLEAIMAAPASRVLVLSASAAPNLLLTFATLCLAVVPAAALTGAAGPLETAAALLLALVGMLPLAGLGMVLAGLVVKFKEPWGALNVAKALIGVVSGVGYPLEVLPEWLRLAGMAFPTTHAISMLRDALIFHRVHGGTLLSLAAVAVMAAVYPAVGGSVLRRVIREAERSGEISTY
ncbi:MAG: hypothetical protein DRO06_02855 [Thermoproteota archaeon]|nr:MAG: hypothetical protein DRO06_02855 [Candidatus Korarchaeota archaeon]